MRGEESCLTQQGHDPLNGGLHEADCPGGEVPVEVEVAAADRDEVAFEIAAVQGLEKGQQRCGAHVVGEGQAGLVGRDGRAVQIVECRVHVGVHEDNPVVALEQVDHLRHQLADEGGVHR
jgi:hypothetical protein